MKIDYILKRILLKSVCLSLGVICCTATSDAASKPADSASQSTEGGSSVLITRKASLGSGVFVTVLLDGKRVKTLIQGSRYQAVLSPGKHVLSVMPDPNLTGQREVRVEITSEKGKAYSFSAARDKAGNLVLQKNS